MATTDDTATVTEVPVLMTTAQALVLFWRELTETEVKDPIPPEVRLAVTVEAAKTACEGGLCVASAAAANPVTETDRG